VLRVLSTRRLPWRLPALLALAAFATPAAAQPGKRVKVTVVVILASDHDCGVDPRLKCIAEEVRKHDPSLRGFRLFSMACESLAVDEKASLRLVEGATTDIVVHCCGDKNNRVTLAVTPPGQGEIVYRTVCGKFLPIVTRYRTRPRVQPCAVVQALGAAQMRSPAAPAVAAAALLAGRTRDRVILAICVQPCQAGLKR
jgi:hypothetical protein